MKEKPRRRWEHAALWVVIVLALLVGYPLSIGPASIVFDHEFHGGYVPAPIIRATETAYAPLFGLAAGTEAGNWLFNYFLFWQRLYWR